MNVRALHAVADAELLQPCSQRSSCRLHRAEPSMAAAGSCERQQQPATAMLNLVMIVHIPGAVPRAREAITWLVLSRLVRMVIH